MYERNPKIISDQNLRKYKRYCNRTEWEGLVILQEAALVRAVGKGTRLGPAFGSKLK